MLAENHNYVPCPDKVCPNCGKTFNRMRTKSGRLEDRAVYAVRTHCSRACAYAARRRKTKEGRHRNHLIGACEACGVEAVLQVHPIDGDPSNDAKENLQLLCWWCYSFWYSLLRRVGRKTGKMPRLF